MPISVADIANDYAVATVTLGGESAQVWFRPNAMTPADEAAFATIQAANDGAASVDFLCGQLAHLVADWELVEADGSKVPVDADRIRQLPTKLVMAIYTTIAQAVRNPMTEGESTPSVAG